RGAEDGLAADRRHADAVAVVADPGDGLVELEAWLAEPEPVEERDRPRSHRDHVAQDPAYAGGRALEGLDRRGVVVRLDLEGDRCPVTKVEHARVLAWPLQDALAGGGQPLQERRRVLVAAVLRPEEREDRELEMVRVTAEQLPDTVRLPVGQTKGAVQGLLGGQLRQVIQCNRGRGGISRDPVALRLTREMRRPAVLLVVLALIWGASFMLIKIADRQLAPATLILARIGSATPCSRSSRLFASAWSGRSPSCARGGAGSPSSGSSTPRFRSGSSRGARPASTPASPRSSRRRCRCSARS